MDRTQYVTIASVSEGGVQYDLVVRRLDPAALDALDAPGTEPRGTVAQEPKVISTKAGTA